MQKQIMEMSNFRAVLRCMLPVLAGRSPGGSRLPSQSGQQDSSYLSNERLACLAHLSHDTANKLAVIQVPGAVSVQQLPQVIQVLKHKQVRFVSVMAERPLPSCHVAM